MLYIKLICVGKMREKYFTDAFEEYRKRLTPLCRFELCEVPEERLPDEPSDKEIQAALGREEGAILREIPQDSYVCALCVEGKQLPSEGIAAMLAERALSGKPKLCFLVGGSFGLSEAVKRRADARLSFSRMTFPHHLARVMLMEQIYRGFAINRGSRYHK